MHVKRYKVAQILKFGKQHFKKIKSQNQIRTFLQTKKALFVCKK